MLRKNCKLFLLMIVLVFSILVCMNFVIADMNDCYSHEERSGGTKISCNNAGCLWSSNDSDDSTNDFVDPWCDFYLPNGTLGHCCMPAECWQYDGQEDSCVNQSDSINCTWEPWHMMTYPNGTSFYGGCFNDYSSGEMAWDMSDGCWQYDADQDGCTSGANAQKCSWSSNAGNENPWCWIKNIYDAQMENSDAITTDIGCCDMKGCWDYDGNVSLCIGEEGTNYSADTSLYGLCDWSPKETDPWCPDDKGCCMTKWCSQIGDETNCTKMKTELMMPCEWDEGCSDSFGGGFMFFNDTDSCFNQGGWWNSSGDCEMPNVTLFGGGGGFMFVEEAHCWFGDNQVDICKNMSGCAYCESGTGANGTGNTSSNNICANKPLGFCEGHDVWEGDTYSNADNSNNLNCSHIKIKSACTYGPLPNCVWNSSGNITGTYCGAGTSSIQKNAPPVPYCDHPDAVNNFTLCDDLASMYLMPCKWGNASSNKTFKDNCTFNANAVFEYGGEKDLQIINSEYTCIAAGGEWVVEYWVDTDDNNKVKMEKWCEEASLFDLSTGLAAGNKGNCDTDCWACEFNSSGDTYPNSTGAMAACTNSSLGYCAWTNDSNAPNDFGYCDYPDEMSYGAGDCQAVCKDCDLGLDPYIACKGSASGCKWANDTNSSGSVLATGVCVGEGKKTCYDDCFSCYDFASCQNLSSLNCQWDDVNYFCKPATFDGEICFDGVDNDGDYLMDCADPDCSFDMSCGGSSFGDCMKHTDDVIADDNHNTSICNLSNAFGDQECVWVNFSWEDVGHCDFPGADCWQYDNNMTACGLTTGCTNTSTTGSGFSNFCDINMTKQDTANCWQYTSKAECNAISPLYNKTTNCTWVDPEWGGGFCDYWLFAQCMNMSNNQTGCNADGNCSWNTWGDGYGMCDVACFNMSLGSSDCSSDDRSEICEWKDSSNSMCFPETFMVMGGGNGSRSGCAQYDGNYSACILKNYTCTWHNDSAVSNNQTADLWSGWCDPKSEYELSGQMEGEMFFLGSDSTDEDIPTESDIYSFGMRVTNNAYGFGMNFGTLANTTLCNGYNLHTTIGGGIGIGNYTTKNYWYLDTNGTSTSGCSAYYPNGTTAPGFDFYISYVVENNTDSGNIETTKKIFRCIIDSSNNWQWVSTNMFVSDNKKFACTKTGGDLLVTIEKESLETFDTFDMTIPMRVLGVTANNSYNRTTPLDSVGPEYYTPGTVDFEFVDCSDPDVKDPKCKNIQKFGFQIFEDCKNGVDDDNDGYTDCEDKKCEFLPLCGLTGAFNFTFVADDNKAPILMFSKVDKMADAAIVMFDSDEPANGSLKFYENDSTCSTLNLTLDDLGDAGFAFDDYKPFHRVSLDIDNLEYNLKNNTAYYYKVVLCDSFTNCGISACLNFTTKKENKNFLFRLDLPDGFTADIPDMGLSGENFTRNVSGKEYQVGFKTNSSVTKKMNITINYTENLSIKFVGVDIYKPKTLDFDGAFIANDTTNELGMNSSSKAWNSLLQDLGLGGSGDYYILNFPVAYNASNNLTWGDEAHDNMTVVTDYVNCSGDTGHTECKSPVTIGFSVYNLSIASSSSSSGDSSSSTGGGGRALSSDWLMTYTASDEQFKEGYTKEMRNKQRIRFTVNNETHYMGIVKLTTLTITINVSSDKIQQATLAVDDLRRFDITEDGYYDLSVKLNSIKDSKASVTIKSIHVEVTAETEAEESEKEEKAKEEEKKAEGEEVESESLTWLWIIIGIIVIVILIGVGFGTKKKSK